MRCGKSRKMVVLGMLGMFLLLFPVWQTPVIAEDGGNLVGWWKMDESVWTGATDEVKDSSGRGNHLTAAGKGKMPAIVTTGKVKAGEFKASEGQYLYAPSYREDLKVGEKDFTLMARVKSNDLAARCGILGMAVADYTSTCYGFYQRDNAYYFIVNGPNKGEKWPFLIKRPIRPGWCHLAGVRDGNKICFYIDGKLRATKEGASAINPDENGDYFIIGASDSNGKMLPGGFFNGLIGDVRLYKGTALTAKQITEEYNRLKDAFSQAEKQEIVVYEQDFEKYQVGEKKISGMSGHPALPDVAVTDNAYYTSSRALKIVCHPELKINHLLRFSPRIPISSDCILKVSLRVKFEDVVNTQNHKNRYPYIFVTVFDENRKQIQCLQVLYSVTTTDSESSADDNWIMLKKEFAIQEGACRFELAMYMFEDRGTSGTVYIDDIKIVQKFSNKE